MLTLGVPGDAVTAVIIGALFIHGLKPGPMLMIETPHLFWFWVGVLTLANIFLLPLGLSGIRIFAKLVEIPKGLLLPIIIIISVVGTYAINNSITDVYWMIGFGIFGYILKMYGFRNGTCRSGYHSWPSHGGRIPSRHARCPSQHPRFFFDLIRNPISLVLTLGIIFSVLSGTQFWARMKGKVWKSNKVAT